MGNGWHCCGQWDVVGKCAGYEGCDCNCATCLMERGEIETSEPRCDDCGCSRLPELYRESHYLFDSRCTCIKPPPAAVAVPNPRIDLIGYAAEEIFSTEEIILFGWAERFAAKVPSRQPDGEWVRCHEVARAVGGLLNLTVVDGVYGHVQHSWLDLPVAERPDLRRHVLDVYAPGRLPRVQLIDAWYLLPEGSSYKPGLARGDIREDIVAWLKLKMEQ